MSPFAVIFDMDGVLVDSEVVAARVESELFAELGIDVGVEDIYDRFVGLSQASVIDLVRREWNVDLPDWFLAKRIERIHARFAAEGRAVPGIGSVVDRLVANGVPIAVASSSRPESIAHKLSVTGLDAFFGRHVYSAELVEHGKPAPDLFLYAADRLGVTPAACTVVEDSVPGVVAGAAAGMDVVGFSAAGHCGPDHGERLRRAGATRVASHSDELAAMVGVTGD